MTMKLARIFYALLCVCVLSLVYLSKLATDDDALKITNKIINSDLIIPSLNGTGDVMRTQVGFRDIFAYMPRLSLKCEALFPDRNKDNPLNFEYTIYRQKLEEKLEGMLVKPQENDQVPEDAVVLYHLSMMSFVENICEIGFNAGYNALLWFSANAVVSVRVFDEGRDEQLKHIAEWLKEEQFPTRFFMRWGDLNDSLSSYSRDPKQPKCDVVLINRSCTLPVDMVVGQIQKLVNPKHNIVIFRDHHSTHECTVPQPEEYPALKQNFDLLFRCVMPSSRGLVVYARKFVSQ